MGTLKNQKLEKKDASAAKRLAERRANRGSGVSADLTSIAPSAVLKLVYAATASGAQITFGYTRDYGAYVLKIWYQGEADVQYIRPTEDADREVNELTDFFVEELREGRTGGTPPPADIVDGLLRYFEAH